MAPSHKRMEGCGGGPAAQRGKGEHGLGCLAFVGLSWTLNVFLINCWSVSKPLRRVYNQAIKWERRISLPENIRWGLEGGQKAPSGLGQPLAWD